MSKLFSAKKDGIFGCAVAGEHPRASIGFVQEEYIVYNFKFWRGTPRGEIIDLRKTNFDLACCLKLFFTTLETSNSTMVGEDFGLFRRLRRKKR